MQVHCVYLWLSGGHGVRGWQQMQVPGSVQQGREDRVHATGGKGVGALSSRAGQGVGVGPRDGAAAIVAPHEAFKRLHPCDRRVGGPGSWPAQVGPGQGSVRGTGVSASVVQNRTAEGAGDSHEPRSGVHLTVAPSKKKELGPE